QRGQVGRGDQPGRVQGGVAARDPLVRQQLVGGQVGRRDQQPVGRELELVARGRAQDQGQREGVRRGLGDRELRGARDRRGGRRDVPRVQGGLGQLRGQVGVREYLAGHRPLLLRGGHAGGFQGAQAGLQAADLGQRRLERADGEGQDGRQVVALARGAGGD